MKFLADENFPSRSVRQLRLAGCEVISISETSPGIEDAEVLGYAVSEGCVLLTFDRDYGELIYLQRTLSPVGVIYFRYQPLTPEEPAEQLLNLLQEKSISFLGRFTVLERNLLRQRPLP